MIAFITLDSELGNGSLVKLNEFLSVFPRSRGGLSRGKMLKSPLSMMLRKTGRRS